MIFYYLSSCNTCQRIFKEINCPKLKLQDLKFNPLTENQLEELYQLSSSYEALFSRKAIKYRSMGLNLLELNEGDYKKYLLLDYTFLKRPVAIVNGKVYIGNSKQNVEELKTALGE